MKKILLTVSILCASFISKSQDLNFNSWENVSTVDEFGDATGDTLKRFFGQGVLVIVQQPRLN